MLWRPPTLLVINCYLRQGGGRVMRSVTFFRSFVRLHNNSQSRGWIRMKFSVDVEDKNEFGNDPCRNTDHSWIRMNPDK